MLGLVSDSHFWFSQSVQSLSHVRLFATPWNAACQVSMSITTSGVYSNSCPLSRWCRPTISSAVIPFFSCLQSFPASGLLQMRQLFTSKVLEFQLQHQSFQWAPRTDLLQDGLVGSPWSPRDSQESSPTLQFKSMNSSELSFLYGPTLTSIHDLWKNHSLD